MKVVNTSTASRISGDMRSSPSPLWAMMSVRMELMRTLLRSPTRSRTMAGTSSGCTMPPRMASSRSWLM